MISTTIEKQSGPCAKPVGPMVPTVVRVREFQRETHDTFTLTVARTAGASHTPRPGQFNMLYVFGVGEVPISISGDCSDEHALVHTIRAVGATTRALGRLQPGDSLGVRGPFGSGWPLDEAAGRDVVVVAGGIGLAPLRPVIYHLVRRRADYGRIVLLYGARTPADLIYTKELEQWRSRFDLQVRVTVDSADPEWRGHIGVVTTLLPQVELDPGRAIGLVCGPEIMMRFTLRELQSRGVPAEQLFVSLERNMQCAIGFCGHCQFGPEFVCMDGPVFRYEQIRHFFSIQEA